MTLKNKIEFRIHLTNVTGLGASTLVKSLLPALERNNFTFISKIYLPDRGELSEYVPTDSSIQVFKYRRILPNILSRFLECCILGRSFSDKTPLLVLGDIPLAGVRNQILFLQTSLLLRNRSFFFFLKDFKYIFLRIIFKKNLRYIKKIIVQTKAMRESLIKKYPELTSKVAVISQPAPLWLMKSGVSRTGRFNKKQKGLSLFYPAAPYPHKNHILLSGLKEAFYPVQNLILTISPDFNPAPRLTWIDCVGRLSENSVIEAYRTVDALLFLSLEESFGFPLIEAMFVGLPIICPDLIYAREICGAQAEFFNPNDPRSLAEAITRTNEKLACGWWPNWKEQMSTIPRDWEDVAFKMLKVSI